MEEASADVQIIRKAEKEVTNISRPNWFAKNNKRSSRRPLDPMGCKEQQAQDLLTKWVAKNNKKEAAEDVIKMF